MSLSCNIIITKILCVIRILNSIDSSRDKFGLFPHVRVTKYVTATFTQPDF